jgi:hypothetical protein
VTSRQDGAVRLQAKKNFSAAIVTPKPTTSIEPS